MVVPPMASAPMASATASATASPLHADALLLVAKASPPPQSAVVSPHGRCYTRGPTRRHRACGRDGQRHLGRDDAVSQRARERVEANRNDGRRERAWRRLFARRRARCCIRHHRRGCLNHPRNRGSRRRGDGSACGSGGSGRGGLHGGVDGGLGRPSASLHCRGTPASSPAAATPSWWVAAMWPGEHPPWRDSVEGLEAEASEVAARMEVRNAEAARLVMTRRCRRRWGGMWPAVGAFRGGCRFPFAGKAPPGQGDSCPSRNLKRSYTGTQFWPPATPKRAPVGSGGL